MHSRFILSWCEYLYPEFQKDYPDAVTVSLEQNYRSTQNIVNAANVVISKNFNNSRKMFSVKMKSGRK
jgi:DNA helicase-2/ATP-dependent DNA helicase PcrA